MELIALAGLAGLSLLANVVLFVFYRRRLAASQAALETAKKRPLAVEASELLQDLATVGAIVRIERIDPEHLFMWRPR
jgi:cell division protein FtsL